MMSRAVNAMTECKGMPHMQPSEPGSEGKVEKRCGAHQCRIWALLMRLSRLPPIAFSASMNSRELKFAPGRDCPHFSSFPSLLPHASQATATKV